MSTVKRLPAGADDILTHHATSYDYISPLKLNLVGKHVLITGAAWEDGVRLPLLKPLHEREHLL